MPHLMPLIATFLLALAPEPLLADPVSDAQRNLQQGNWIAARQQLLALKTSTCDSNFYLGLASANLGDPEGSANAELNAYSCATNDSRRQDVLSLLQWSLNAMAQLGLGAQSMPVALNPYYPKHVNQAYAKREDIVHRIGKIIPGAENSFEIALTLSPCYAYDNDPNPTASEQLACLSNKPDFGPVPSVRL